LKVPITFSLTNNIFRLLFLVGRDKNKSQNCSLFSRAAQNIEKAPAEKVADLLELSLMQQCKKKERKPCFTCKKGTDLVGSQASHVTENFATSEVRTLFGTPNTLVTREATF
jgi:hypothetical protein